MKFIKTLLILLIWMFTFIWFTLLSIPGFIAGILWYPLVNGFLWSDIFLSKQLTVSKKDKVESNKDIKDSKEFLKQMHKELYGG